MSDIEVGYEVVNEETFNQKVTHVNLDQLTLESNELTGTVVIHRNGGGLTPYFGVFEKDEFVDDYGFSFKFGVKK